MEVGMNINPGGRRESAILAKKRIIIFLLFSMMSLALGCEATDPDARIKYILNRSVEDNLEEFGSMNELTEYLKEVRDAQKIEESKYKYDGYEYEDMENAGVEANSGESITNNQVEGVDEGGIVKAVGDFIVVLRRGRIFSISLKKGGESTLSPTHMVDAYPAGSTLGTWYDEMLVYDNRIIVIGYSYRVRATEIGLFRIDGQGTITHENTYFLTSNDYYSSRNYTGRLVGNELIFYMPYYLSLYGEPDRRLPALRQLDETKFDSIIEATDIFRPVQPALYPTLHTIVKCNLDGEELSCNATGVIGPYARNFYVSRDAVYLWVTSEYAAWHTEIEDDGESPRPATVYRLPLIQGKPEVLQAFGSPIDQFSFHEDSRGHLNVLVESQGWGDAMWFPESARYGLSLFRASIDDFSSRTSLSPASSYQSLPSITGMSIQNRFIGDQLLYGGHCWYGECVGQNTLYAKKYSTDEVTKKLDLGHSVERIESLGSGAMVIGASNSDLHFSAIDLENDTVVKADGFVRNNAVQGESRSHGFFFKKTAAGQGVLGLPIRIGGNSWDHLWNGSAEIQFLSVKTGLQLHNLGTLASSAMGETDDSCVVSCVDWYGNARPIFYSGRTFALMGYELVEGTVTEDSIDEIGRINFLAR